MAHVRQNRIDDTFARLGREGSTGLILFLTVGFPSVESTLELVPALAEAGADIIELGVPFSDPLADGPTIQAASFHALEQGVSLKGCVEVAGTLRDTLPDLPLVLMGYYNPVLTYGLSTFVKDASQAGVDGVIVPDLPTEEAGPLRAACNVRGIHLIPLLAPTSTDQRIQEACARASGFMYCVSLTGVTGARDRLPEGVPGMLRRVRRYTSLPLAVGFGVSKREHVIVIGKCAQAAIVGSALVRLIQEAPPEEMVARAKRFVAQLKGTVSAG